MPEPQGFYYREVDERHEESGDITQTDITRTFEMAWEDRQRFIFETFGYATKNGEIVGRTLPWFCPEWLALHPKEWRVKPIGKGIKGNPYGKYEKAHVKITWGVPEFTDLTEDPITGNIVLWSLQVAGNNSYSTIPNAHIKFASDNKPIGQQVARTEQQSSYLFTLHRVPFLPADKLEQMQGGCNGQQFDANSLSAPPQTLKFEDWETDPRETTFSAGGILIPAWTIRITLVKRINGWNKMVRQDNGNYDTVTPTGAIIPISPINFNFLKTLQA